MKRIGVLALALAATFIGAQSTDNQAYLAILAETKLMQMAGMPKIELPPGVKLPPNVQMPGSVQRTLNVRLWSPSIAPDSATATLLPPAGLKQGPKLDLELYRPKGETDDTGGNLGNANPDQNPNFTIKYYWGSSETVQPGQPKVISWGGLTPEQKAAMRKQAREAQPGRGSYFYKPNWTTGYWPTPKQAGAIAADASLVGTYTLNSNYTGSVSLDAPSDVEFLPAIEMSSPNLAKRIDLTKSIPFQWSPITNALGQYATIIGMEGKNTLIVWSSSEVFSEGLMGEMGFLQMAEVRQRVSDKLFMPGDVTKMTVPIGIFQNADMAMLMMSAYGHGSALEKGQPLPRIQTKSSLNIMLGGKQMRDMGGMGGSDDGDDGE